MENMHSRLRQARVEAGYSSASAAARAHGWRASTYIAHENGQNQYDAAQAQEYATAFKTQAEWLLLGRDTQVSDIESELRLLPPEDARKLIDEFHSMIRAAKLIRRKK
jgi:phage repressor protein C with HTH and peptisase S24 domain